MHSPLLRLSFPRPRVFRYCRWLLLALACHLTAAKALAASDVKVVLGSTELANSSRVDFGAANVGSSVSKSFTFTNDGPHSMLNLSFSVTGAHTADYILSAPNYTGLLPAEWFTFSVTFRPTAVYTRTAAVRIASNDPDE